MSSASTYFIEVTFEEQRRQLFLTVKALAHVISIHNFAKFNLDICISAHSTFGDANPKRMSSNKYGFFICELSLNFNEITRFQMTLS